MTPAITFEPDSVALAGNQMMGRRAAGSAFLRAAVEGAEGGSLTCYTPARRSAEVFAEIVQGIDPGIAPRWIAAPGFAGLRDVGGLYLADPRLGRAAKLRLRARPDAYFLTGITHTLSSSTAIAMIAESVAGPVMPWDALICTSTAARSVVETVMRDEANYLAWRLGTGIQVPGPMLPVIPLGVHTADFATDADRRAAARDRLAIGADETVFLFAGRLSFHGKAHPFEMLRGLDMAAARTGRRVTLVLAGQFFNAAIEDAYRSALAQFAPNVRAIVIDGVDDAAYAEGWAAADAFVSLSDNFQETFGITPVEAMAAGLPVVVSDWNGYRDTVRDGVDGFRIPSWAPAPGTGFDSAGRYEAGAMTFDQQASQSSTAVSVDMAVLVDRLAALIEDPALRARLGASGQVRARAEYDWSVVYGRYRALWAEQAAVRARAASDPAMAQRLALAPREAAPFRDHAAIFASYPTHHVKPATPVTLVQGATIDLFEALTGHVSLNRWNPPVDVTGAWIDALRAGPRTVADLSLATRQEPVATADWIARLAKLGIVRLG